jgi:tetratricopeptide (TPR) repeat protein
LQRKDVSPQDQIDVRLSLAQSYRQQKNYAAAQEQYRRILEMNETSPREKLNLQLQSGHTAWEAQDYAAARAEYARLVAMPEAPAHYRSYAQSRLAQSYVREKDYAAARAEYGKLLTMEEAPAHHRWEAQECLREIDRLEAGLLPRDPAWSRVQLPPQPAPAVEFYVAPDGDDTNPGTWQRPFATLQRARDAIRALKGQGGLPAGGSPPLAKGGKGGVAQPATRY